MKFLKFILITLIFINCREDIEENNIVGTWKLTAQLIDPGDGSGGFSSVNSNKTITFKTNGSYESNGNMCTINTESNQNSTGTYVYTDTQKNMLPENCAYINVTSHNLKIENGELIISNFGCIESCAQKFIKIQN